MAVITDRLIDQAFSDLKSTYGGVREDYFGLLYLEKEFHIPREDAAVQIAFGGNDYGLDGFHFDLEKHNLYLYQFKWSSSYTLFKQSFHRLIDVGMERVFGNPKQDQLQNQMLLQLRSQLLENQSVVERVFVHFVFNGDPAEAERSQVLDKLREDLEGKKYLIDNSFGKSVSMAVQFRSASRVGTTGHKRVTHTYPIELQETLQQNGPHGELMHIGFVRLVDLHSMYRDMNERFFERNIRAGLEEDSPPNRAIDRALKQMILDETDDPSAFAFNHNGVSISAEQFESHEGKFKITEPRVLNGAQTITTFDRFLKKNEDNPRLKEGHQALCDLQVLCKIITEAEPEFITTVTINNNRQNPVLPWNLHANDMIQLELQDKFRDDLGIYYERQENAFANLTQQDLDDLDIAEYKTIELLRFTQTLLMSEGEIDKLSRMREVFENDKLYSQVFNGSRLQADSRKIVLCYKIQFRLRRLIRDIIDKGANKYAYMNRGRYILWALLCQAMLNDDQVEKHTANLGTSLAIEADFTDWISRLTSTRVRFLISEAVKGEPYASMVEEGKYDFLRTRAFYDKCMDIAYKKWKWVQKKLK